MEPSPTLSHPTWKASGGGFKTSTNIPLDQDLPVVAVVDTSSALVHGRGYGSKAQLRFIWFKWSMIELNLFNPFKGSYPPAAKRQSFGARLTSPTAGSAIPGPSRRFRPVLYPVKRA